MKAWMSRNIKEILRDPLTLIFGIGLPILLLGMMTVINAAVPVQVWQFLPENFVPGMAVFSLSFVTLFSGLLLAKDRSSAFLSRVCASPLRASAYILGYALPLDAGGTAAMHRLSAGGAAVRFGLYVADFRGRAGVSPGKPAVCDAGLAFRHAAE